MRSFKLAILAILSFTAMSNPAAAQYNAKQGGAFDRASASLKQEYLVPYVGYFDATQNDNAAVQLGAEYRFAPYYYSLRPTVGFNITTDGSAYGYGGVFWDIDVMNGTLWLTPNFVAGLYHSGDGKKLGGAVEFRSGIELSYMFENQHRVGIAFNHISNASLYDRNPGAETLLINYHVPVSDLGNLF